MTFYEAFTSNTSSVSSVLSHFLAPAVLEPSRPGATPAQVDLLCPGCALGTHLEAA